MDGYYEWVATPEKKKQPYFLHDPSGGVLSAAGLLEFTRRADDDWLVTYTIITREARDASGKIHDRMPVFLETNVWQQWLNPVKLDEAARLDALDLLHDSSEIVARTLQAHPVSMQVNNVRTVDPRDRTLIEPVSMA